MVQTAEVDVDVEGEEVGVEGEVVGLGTEGEVVGEAEAGDNLILQEEEEDLVLVLVLEVVGMVGDQEKLETSAMRTFLWRIQMMIMTMMPMILTIHKCRELQRKSD